jgi:hypothetical protein
MPDFPDQPDRDPFQEGWYKVRFLDRYTTPRTGTTFATEDTPAKEVGRNIMLVGVATRQRDQQTINAFGLVHYRAEDFTPEALAATAKIVENGLQGTRQSIFHATMGRLNKITGTRFQQNGKGGYDLKPIVGKEAWVNLKFRKQQDGSKGKYLEFTEYRTLDKAPDPKRTTVF